MEYSFHCDADRVVASIGNSIDQLFTRKLCLRHEGLQREHWIASRCLTNRKPMRVLLLLLFTLSCAVMVFAQQPALDPIQAAKLAEQMCGQLPNVATILETIKIQDPKLIAQLQGGKVGVPRKPPVTDDVYDALVSLGPYSVPCLVDRLTDARWMPDPRSEPLLGAPVVGDVAYMVLMDKGVADILPSLARKRPEDMRMDDYFLWPSAGDHRRRLQAAVRAWLGKHPNCCSAPPMVSTVTPVQAKFRMSAAELAKARLQFARLRPGMSTAQSLRIAGKPDAMDRGEQNSGTHNIGLLGYCAMDHNETLAYIYFTERWTDEIASRDPLRDRYVILFFSGDGKLTRMFSNVAGIGAMYPSSRAAWMRLMWGMPSTKSSTQSH